MLLNFNNILSLKNLLSIIYICNFGLKTGFNYICNINDFKYNLQW